MKSEKDGFTIVELLTSLAIIALLVGILMPTLSYVNNKAKITAQRAYLTTIDMAILTFKNDMGYFPPSDSTSTNPQVKRPENAEYCGAQKLCEALLGWDLMGFHPDTAWRANGIDNGSPPNWWTYDESKQRDFNGDGVPDTLFERKGPYLELATTKVFRLGSVDDPEFGQMEGLFRDPAPLAAKTFVLCDIFGAKRIKTGTGQNQKVVKAGTPILYFRANTSSKTLTVGRPWNRIYNFFDNIALLTTLKSIASGEKIFHPLGDNSGNYAAFYEYIRDPRAVSMASQVTYTPWPYRPDSYILITAGPDGLYGTADDICNFPR